MTRIAELYGLPTDVHLTGTDWASVITSQHCPYLNRKCLKNRKSEPDLTISSCSLYFGKLPDIIMICPFRLLERQQIFMDCTHLLSLHQPGNELGGRKKITGPLGRYPMLFPGSQNGCGLGFKLGE